MVCRVIDTNKNNFNSISDKNDIKDEIVKD